MRAVLLILVLLAVVLAAQPLPHAHAQLSEVCVRLFCSATFPLGYPQSCAMPDLLPDQTRQDWCAAYWNAPPSAFKRRWRPPLR